MHTSLCFWLASKDASLESLDEHTERREAPERKWDLDFRITVLQGFRQFYDDFRPAVRHAAGPSYEKHSQLSNS